VEQTNAIAKDFVASYFDFIDSNRRRLGGLYVNPPLHNRVSNSEPLWLVVLSSRTQWL
jgi:hypothetical protein